MVLNANLCESVRYFEAHINIYRSYLRISPTRKLGLPYCFQHLYCQYSIVNQLDHWLSSGFVILIRPRKAKKGLLSSPIFVAELLIHIQLLDPDPAPFVIGFQDANTK
jgi:hypothetical protein